MISPGSDTIIDWFKNLQDDICHSLEILDGHATFKEDVWERAEGGGGRTRILLGEHIEKGGVAFSAVHGTMPEVVAKQLNLQPNNFLATGVSIVLHACNPHVPIIHMNVRYFETDTGHWWFGGGIDVTPHYIDISQAKSFHKRMKEVCDSLGPSVYLDYKKWADDYFYNHHRKETRGIGGIFFDQLNESKGYDRQSIWNFVQRVGLAFIPSYKEVFTPNYMIDYTDEDLQWQSVRRSRYVEYNLVYDRGTKFGLQTNGRIESILMSMPPSAQWHYDYQAPNEAAKITLGLLKKDQDWLTGKVM